MAPLLVVAIGVAGLGFGSEAAQGRILAELEGVVGTSGAEAVDGLIESSHKPKTGIIATILGSATLLIGAAGSIVVLVLWVYYFAQIFYFGAELTQAYARAHGSRIGPRGDVKTASAKAR